MKRNVKSFFRSGIRKKTNDNATTTTTTMTTMSMTKMIQNNTSRKTKEMTMIERRKLVEEHANMSLWLRTAL